MKHVEACDIIMDGKDKSFDGKGYPRGLAGDEIPLCGRIMAVADVYDALVDDRVYRRGMKHIEACNIIMDGKNKSFDGRVVDAFQAIHADLAAEAKKSADRARQNRGGREND
jgi:putative two-component system response regulator